MGDHYSSYYDTPPFCDHCKKLHDMFIVCDEYIEYASKLVKPYDKPLSSVEIAANADLMRKVRAARLEEQRVNKIPFPWGTHITSNKI